jgi:hypothetical protein
MAQKLETSVDAALKESIKRKNSSTSAAAKRAKVKSKTNFDDTYADVIFPFVFATKLNAQAKAVANTAGLEKAQRSATVKVKVALVKQAKIDSTAGIVIGGNGAPIGHESGFGAVKPIKVTFRTTLVARRGSATGRSAKTYKKEWKSLSVPKSATALDVIAWIKNNWGVQPDQLQIGSKIYNIKPRKKVYNNPTIAQTAASAL